MRIVVTGAGGNVGRHVVVELASRGHEVAAVDRTNRPPDLTASVSSWTVGDVGDPALMAGVMASSQGRSSFRLLVRTPARSLRRSRA